MPEICDATRRDANYLEQGYDFRSACQDWQVEFLRIALGEEGAFATVDNECHLHELEGVTERGGNNCSSAPHTEEQRNLATKVTIPNVV